MFFSGYKALKILDVYKVSRKAEKVYCSARPWSAIALRLSGESVFEVNSKKYSAAAGSVIYIPSGISFLRESTDEDLIIIHVKCYEDEVSIPDVINNNCLLLIANEMNKIYDEWQKKSSGYEQRCTAVLYMILENLSYVSLPVLKSGMIKPGAVFIEENFDVPEISVEHAAKMCNISEVYFRKLYKKEYGISPHNAIITKRIKKACSLLQSGYFTVAEAAELSGFQNCKYFSTLFRKITQKSPREYKEQFQTVNTEKRKEQR